MAVCLDFVGRAECPCPCTDDPVGTGLPGTASKWCREETRNGATTSTEPRRQWPLHAVPGPDVGDGPPGKQALITVLREHSGGASLRRRWPSRRGSASPTARRLLGDGGAGRGHRTPGSGGGPGRMPDRFSLADDLADEATAPTGPGPLAVVPTAGTRRGQHAYRCRW